MPEGEYAEYYARLGETADAWKRTKTQLAKRFPNRPILVLHHTQAVRVAPTKLKRRLWVATFREQPQALDPFTSFGLRRGRLRWR